MPGKVRNVSGIICWVIAGFFLYNVGILSFINQPLWPVKLAILGAFLVPVVVFLLLAAWCRGFSRMGRELGIVLLSAGGVTLFGVLMFVALYASPETAKQMPPNTREMFSAIWFGGGCLTLYLVLGLVLVLCRREPKAQS